jgi:SAM-dependent methyltransferase
MAHAQLAVAASNTEQARAWDGDEGRYWADHAEEFDAALRAYQPTFMSAAALRVGHAVLDVGCGTGQCSVEAAQQVTGGEEGGRVLGVDLSEAMLEVARDRARRVGLVDLTFLKADAQVHPFAPESFDTVIGRTSAMFFGDPAQGFANLFTALRPGGRLVLLVWQPLERNEWLHAILGALTAGRPLPLPPPGGPGPFALSQPARVRELLAAAGFSDVDLRGLERPMYFGPTAEDATAFMHGLNAWMLRDLGEQDRAHALDALSQVMRDHQGERGVELGSAMWLVTASRP